MYVKMIGKICVDLFMIICDFGLREYLLKFLIRGCMLMRVCWLCWPATRQPDLGLVKRIHQILGRRHEHNLHVSTAVQKTWIEKSFKAQVSCTVDPADNFTWCSFLAVICWCNAKMLSGRFHNLYIVNSTAFWLEVIKTKPVPKN